MRGQLFSIDFIVALSLILFLFALSLYVSDSVASAINSNELNSELRSAAAGALSQLLETPGSPSNWQEMEFSETGINSLGIASGRNVIDVARVDYFFQIGNSDPGNYALIKRMLALDLPGSNYSLIVEDANGILIYDLGPIPQSPFITVSGQRIALLEGEPVLVNLKLWVEK
ncbi:MAG: hypothetical protein ABH863_03560 [Candidatus Micrarchaeota archaeon]